MTCSFGTTLYRVGQKKWIFVIFWDPKMYCSKNDPSRGSFMRGIRISHFQDREKSIPAIIFELKVKEKVFY